MQTAVLSTHLDSNAIRNEIKHIDNTVKTQYAFIEKCESSEYAKNRRDMFGDDIAAREMDILKMMSRRAELVNALSAQQYN